MTNRRWQVLIAAAAVGVFGFGVADAATTAPTPDQNLAAAALAYAQAEGWTPPSPSPTPTPSPSTTVTPSPSPTVSVTPSPSATPSPTSTPSPTGWPGASNTGVPSGTSLTAYTGSGTIPAGTYTAKKFTGDMLVNSGTVNINSSEIDGTIRTSGSAILNVTDVTIDGGQPATESFINLQGSNINALRVNLHGGNAGFSCSDNCTATDSWFHDPYVVGAKHYDAVGANGVNGFVVRHNTISCTNTLHAAGATGGCSADIGFFGDFGVIQNVTVDNNLFVASSNDAGYCVITNANKPGKADPVGVNLHYTNNVWQRGSNAKCGQFGPVDEWQAGNGNVWTGNTWNDGTPLNE